MEYLICGGFGRGSSFSVAVCCSVLQCVKVWCSDIYSLCQRLYPMQYLICGGFGRGSSFSVAVRCSVLKCGVVCCSVLQCIVLFMCGSFGQCDYF